MFFSNPPYAQPLQSFPLPSICQQRCLYALPCNILTSHMWFLKSPTPRIIFFSINKSNLPPNYLMNLVIPQKFLTVEDNEYLAWEWQDQLLLSSFQSPISHNKLTRVVGYKSLWQLWDKIHVFFHSHTNAWARKLRNELRSTALKINLQCTPFAFKPWLIH